MSIGLQKALEKGKLEKALEFLLDHQHPFTSCLGDPQGNTTLHWICQNAPLDILFRFLTKLKSQTLRTPNESNRFSILRTSTYQTGHYSWSEIMNVRNFVGETPLDQIAKQGMQSKIHLLMSFGGITFHFLNSKLNFTPKNFDEIFELQQRFVNASYTQRLAIVDKMQTNIGLSTPVNEYESPLFFYILEKGDLRTIDYALHKLSSTEINAANKNKQTALMLAANQGNQMVVHLLLHHGADPSLQDNYGRTAKFFDRSKHLIFQKRSLDHLFNDFLRNTFDERKFINILHYFKDNGISMLTPVRSDGSRLLHLVITYGSLKALHYALAQIAEDQIDCTNDEDLTPLMAAIEIKSRLKVQALLKKGANPNLQTKEGISALSLAENLQMDLNYPARAIEDYLDLHQILENAFNHFKIDEAIVNIERKGYSFEEPIDHEDNTLLHRLIRNIPYLMLLKSCILDKTNLNSQNIWGETPLIVAAKRRRHAICQLLIERGADPSLKDSQGKTFQDYQTELAGPMASQTDGKTYFEYLYHAIISVPHFVKMKPHRKVDTIFKIFLELIQSEKLKYHGIVRDEGFYLLDCVLGKRYTVNCFDLAFALGYLIKYFEIDPKVYVYYDYHSISPNQRALNIHGQFTCFDPEHHARTMAEFDCYTFDKHCVIECLGTYYDLTFSCFYDNAKDVLISDTIVENQMDLKGRKFLFPMAFLVNLTKIFPATEWDHHQNKNEIVLSKQSSKLSIDVDINGKVTFQATDLDYTLLEKTLLAWQQLNITSSNFNISSNDPRVANALSETLYDPHSLDRSFSNQLSL